MTTDSSIATLEPGPAPGIEAAPDAIAIRRKSALACSSSGVSLCWLRSSRCRYSATKRGAIGMGRRFSV
jgi:hypothetical protein